MMHNTLRHQPQARKRRSVPEQPCCGM